MQQNRLTTGLVNKKTKPLKEHFTPTEQKPKGEGIRTDIPRPGSGGEGRQVAIIGSTLRALFLAYGGIEGLDEYKQSEAFEKNAAALGLSPENLERIVIEEVSGIERPPSESDIAKPPVA